jgi:hypothetical protein
MQGGIGIISKARETSTSIERFTTAQGCFCGPRGSLGASVTVLAINNNSSSSILAFDMHDNAPR